MKSVADGSIYMESRTDHWIWQYDDTEDSWLELFLLSGRGKASSECIPKRMRRQSLEIPGTENSS